MENKVIKTNGVPQCPYCNKPTKRTGGGGSVTTMWYEPLYDENGINTNPDRNTITSTWKCLGCNKYYTIFGNEHDGYQYKQ